jgi:tetratricopeptide (TPR) repeat protein
MNCSPFASENLDSAYQNNLGCSYFGLGSYHLAETHFKRARHLLSQSKKQSNYLPHYFESLLYNHGLTLMKLSKPTEALDCLRIVKGLVKSQHWIIDLRMAECCIQIYTREQERFKTSTEGSKTIPIAGRLYEIDRRSHPLRSHSPRTVE